MARVIDLYSGIGGWTLGFKLAGVEVVASYEYWQPAIDTHEANFESEVFKKNIRNLDLKSLPKNIDFVVGSPPCTTFSYANKGGGGDIADGLKDLVAFFKVVEHVKPKYWAMENVPRVKGILDSLLEHDPNFQKYKILVKYNEVVTCSDLGVPQKRARMIAGNFPFKVIQEMKGKLDYYTLGDCVCLLKQEVCEDLIYKQSLPQRELCGTDNEESLNMEELRMNRESKTYNPVYNKMAFPDKTQEPSRTITSTCTRVSRESIIIEDNQNFRRLNLRERALAQGFPINFNFRGNSYSDQLKMVGNAIPPPVTYLIACAMLGQEPQGIKRIKDLSIKTLKSRKKHISYNPNTKTKRYPLDRTFKFCIPNLRFGSGVRFQLSNKDNLRNLRWEIQFFYGNSKKIIKHDLRCLELESILKGLGENKELSVIIKRISKYSSTLDLNHLQSVWNHSSTGLNPFTVIDKLGLEAMKLIKVLNRINKEKVTKILFHELYKSQDSQNKFNVKKMTEFSPHFVAGIILGSTFNSNINENL